MRLPAKRTLQVIWRNSSVWSSVTAGKLTMGRIWLPAVTPEAKVAARTGEPGKAASIVPLATEVWEFPGEPSLFPAVVKVAVERVSEARSGMPPRRAVRRSGVFMGFCRVEGSGGGVTTVIA